MAATSNFASLNGVNLPVQFSYRPYVQNKRNTTTPTANAAVVQHAPNQIVHGDKNLKWTITGTEPPEYQSLFNLYNTAVPVLYTFLGYWGENYSVYFTVLGEPKYRGRLASVSGEFQIITVNTEYNMTCNTGL